MSLDYAADQLFAALRTLSSREGSPADRLQAAWDENVQMLWMKPCLTRDLLAEFRDLWHRCTAPSEERTSTKLRTLGTDELEHAVDDLISLARRTALMAANTSDDLKLATLADLS